MKISDSLAYYFTVIYKVYLDCNRSYIIDAALDGRVGGSFDFRRHIQDMMIKSLTKGPVTKYDIDVVWDDTKDTDDLQVKDFIFDLYLYLDDIDIKGYVESNIYKGESGVVGLPPDWSEAKDDWYDYIIDTDYDIKLDSISFIDRL